MPVPLPVGLYVTFTPGLSIIYCSARERMTFSIDVDPSVATVADCSDEPLANAETAARATSMIAINFFIFISPVIQGMPRPRIK